MMSANLVKYQFKRKSLKKSSTVDYIKEATTTFTHLVLYNKWVIPEMRKISGKLQLYGKERIRSTKPNKLLSLENSFRKEAHGKSIFKLLSLLLAK